MKTLKNIISFLSISLLVLKTTLGYGCGWYENSETTRLAFFRAELTNMEGFRPFYYSADFYNTTSPDDAKIDRYKNCKEWQTKLGTGVKMNDIYLILYNTSPEAFEISCEKNELKKNFGGNTFIEKLILPKNKELLTYLQFSKELEYCNFQSDGKWESWVDLNSWHYGFTVKIEHDYSLLKEKLKTLKDVFLIKRYAFQFIKISYYLNDLGEACKLYDTHFSDKEEETILQPWALLYKALATDKVGDTIQANYLYSQVFDQCEEKKYVCMQWFNKKPSMVERTLLLAKDDHERSVILTMACLRNPGKALPKLKEIFNYKPSDHYFGALVMREINKVEDWIFTPMLTEYGPSVQIGEEWYTDFEQTKKINAKIDKAYSKELKRFLIDCHKKTKAGDLKDLLSVAIAHLCFINDENETGKLFLSAVRKNAPVSILRQKNIQLALITIKSEDINAETTKEKLVNNLIQLEKNAKLDYDVYKSLYSLTRILSKEYQQQNRIAISGLLFLKSEQYKSSYETKNEDWGYDDYQYFFEDYYWPLAYFDRYAKTTDIDELMLMVTSKMPTPFERYIREKHFSNINALKDLKATIAFRDDNLELTEKTLAEIPKNYWNTHYEFKDYLNEDPFLPKVLSYAYKRNYNYEFNKLTFIKEIRSLLAEADTNDAKKGGNYIKVGHAYFNCSYWGNSWMMTNYGKGTDEDYSFSNDYLFGGMFEKRTKMQQKNYYKCALAKKYYKSALKYAINNEEKAMASLMIYCCNEAAYDFDVNQLPYETKAPNFIPEKETFALYRKYSQTSVFRKYQCPELEYYLATK